MPVVFKLKEIYKIWKEIFPHIEKSHRQTIGMKIDTLFIEELEYSFLASYASSDKKSELIEKAIIANDLLKFFLMVCWELKIITDKKYILLTEKLVETGRMSAGWEKYVKNKTSANNDGRKK